MREAHAVARRVLLTQGPLEEPCVLVGTRSTEQQVKVRLTSAMRGKRIVPLKFDNWTTFTVRTADQTEFAQPLFGLTELRIDPSRQHQIRKSCCSSTCLCCGTPLVGQERIGPWEEEDAGTITYYTVCPACGFWRFRLTDVYTHGYYAIPSVREFAPDSETPALLHLAEEVRSRPGLLYSLDPYVFERFVGTVLRSVFACEVYHVGRTADDGIDLFAIVKDEPLMIQVKRRTSATATEGIDVVKLLFASSFAKDARHAAVVTTARRFSPQARKWVKSPRLVEEGFRFTLVDFEDLMSMVGAVATNNAPPPWLAHRNRRDGPARMHPHGWRLHSLADHDYLIRTNGGEAEALLFDHSELDTCTLVTGDKESVVTCLANWTPCVPTRTNDIHCTPRRTDWDLEHDLDISLDIAEQLTSRWLQLYPDRVMNFDY